MAITKLIDEAAERGAGLTNHLLTLARKQPLEPREIDPNALVAERQAELVIDARLDHRRLEAQGLALEPKSQIGTPARCIEGEGIEAADRAEIRRNMASGSSPIPFLGSRRSPSSNRPSRIATWRSSRIVTAMGLTSSMRSWARCVALATMPRASRSRWPSKVSP